MPTHARPNEVVLYKAPEVTAGPGGGNSGLLLEDPVTAYLLLEDGSFLLLEA